MWRHPKTKEHCFDLETAAYICQTNGCIITYDQYQGMDEKGQWRSTDGSIYYDEELDQFYNFSHEKVDPPRHIGVELPSMYSHFFSWEQLVREWNAAKRELERSGDQTKLKTFINTRLGEEWKEKGQGADKVSFTADRLEPKKEHISNEILFITMGVDCHSGTHARIEYEIVGNGVGEESWSIEYGKIYGDPDLPKVWQEFDKIRRKKFIREDGVNLVVQRCGIDSGHKPDAVYKYVLSRPGQGVYAVKGASTSNQPIVSEPNKKKKPPVYMVGTDTAKELFYTRLNELTEPGPGYCHFPAHYPEEYFLQITSEEKKTVRDKKTGRSVYKWVKIREQNHLLDCRVYSMAALRIETPNLNTLKLMIAAEAERIKNNLPAPQTNKGRRVRSQGIQ